MVTDMITKGELQKYSTDPVGKLSSPRIINLVSDPNFCQVFGLLVRVCPLGSSGSAGT
jgi:hypothetical protein